MSPRIAVPQGHSAADYAAQVLPEYCRALELAGGEPVPLALSLSNEEIAGAAASCDAVLLPGSRADVNPEKYNAARDPHTNPSDPPRDNVDELLLQDAYSLRKPVLAICFGLQSLNVWRSGTLIQRLVGPRRHFGVPGNPAPPHPVVVTPGSLLAAILRQSAGGDSGHGGRSSGLEQGAEHDLPLAAGESYLVNSSHHQAAQLVGDGLRAVAWCPDDQVIEALEGTSPGHWVVAVQWHPERMLEDAHARALFRAFVEAAHRTPLAIDNR
jgi:putative glutamine amidotransferase